METYDHIIIGAGVVGLTLARKLVDQGGQHILVIEKEPGLGSHASGRNSGVLHSGLYYKPGTLKAQLCVKGSQQMKVFCAQHRIPVHHVGKVVVPTSPGSHAQIDTILSYGKANGVPLEDLDQQNLKEIEPDISPDIGRGIYSPSTSVVDPKSVLKAFAQELSDHGVKILYNNLVQDIDADKKHVYTQQGAYGYRHLINCAGSYADKLAHSMGVGKQFTILPFKGLYYKLSPFCDLKINGNIYPVPDLKVPFLGVHFTRAVSGDVYIGPTAIPALGRENYHRVSGMNFADMCSISKSLTKQFITNQGGFRRLMMQELPKLSKAGFFRAAQKLAPRLQPSYMQHSQKVGIRAQLYNKATDQLEMDFNIERGPDSTHVLNAISPAFTCSLSFADYAFDNYLAGA